MEPPTSNSKANSTSTLSALRKYISLLTRLLKTNMRCEGVYRSDSARRQQGREYTTSPAKCTR